MRSLFRKIREANRPLCTALVAAAGSSSRMGGTDKLMETGNARSPHPFLSMFFLTSHMAASTITAIPAVTSPWTFKG